MKVQLVLPLTILTSAMLVGFIKIRKKEIEKQEKLSRFQDIKIRVTNDVMQEYQNDQIENQKQLEKAQNDMKNMEEEVNMLRTKAEKTRGDADICLGAKKSDADQLAASETNLNNAKDESEKEMSDLKREVDELKKQLADRSAVCNFLKETPDPIKTMCGIKDEPKPKEEEAPKQEEKKVEAPKQEEKKVEAPKQEEQKVEAPKKEEQKVEAPKQEEQKVEAPKQEEQKVEAPKQEEQKVEAPKQEEQKVEAPKQEEQKVEAPKQEEQKVEAPKKEEQKA